MLGLSIKKMKKKKKKKKRIVPPKTLLLIGTFGVLYGVSSSPELMGWATIHFKILKKKIIMYSYV